MTRAHARSHEECTHPNTRAAHERCRREQNKEDMRLAQIADDAWCTFWGYGPDEVDETDRDNQLAAMVEVVQAVRAELGGAK